MSISDKIKGRLNGRFDRAYALARKSQFDNSESVELRAVRAVLLGDVGDLTDAELSAVEQSKSGEITPSAAALLDALVDRSTFTSQQRRVVEVAARLTFLIPEPSPEPPEDLELLRKIGEAGAVTEAHRGLTAQAQEIVVLAEIERRRVFSDPTSSEGRKAAVSAKCQAAKDEMRAAHSAWERAQSTLVDLQQSRQRMHCDWRREQSAKVEA